MQIKSHYGNIELLKLCKTAFLCSRQVPASAVLKCYDWAKEKRTAGTCVISGFHSQLEKDVLHFLLKGNQPIIMAIARGLKKEIEPEFIKPIEQGRLLIVSPFDETITRASEKTCQERNKLMINLADNITIGYTRKGGLLEELLRDCKKEVEKLDF
jgi:predicted Rossmann fold nucleotide-binding protein DprA/Smf involved in DNA uptake